MMGRLTEWAMFRLSMVVLITVLSCETGFAQGDGASANEKMPNCRVFAADTRAPGTLSDGFCGGLVVGLSLADPATCLPTGVTNQQAVRVVVQYIDQRPARMHESFLKLTREALRLTWPCKAQR